MQIFRRSKSLWTDWIGHDDVCFVRKNYSTSAWCIYQKHRSMMQIHRVTRPKIHLAVNSSGGNSAVSYRLPSPNHTLMFLRWKHTGFQRGELDCKVSRFWPNILSIKCCTFNRFFSTWFAEVRWSCNLPTSLRSGSWYIGHQTNFSCCMGRPWIYLRKSLQKKTARKKCSLVNAF